MLDNYGDENLSLYCDLCKSKEKVQSIIRRKRDIERNAKQRKYILYVSHWITTLIDCEACLRMEFLLPKFYADAPEAVQIDCSTFLLVFASETQEFTIDLKAKQLIFKGVNHLTVPRSNFKCIFANESVYAIGDKICEKFSLNTRKWAQVPELNAYVNSPYLFCTNQRFLHAFLPAETLQILDLLDEESGWSNVSVILHKLTLTEGCLLSASEAHSSNLNQLIFIDSQVYDICYDDGSKIMTLWSMNNTVQDNMLPLGPPIIAKGMITFSDRKFNKMLRYSCIKYKERVLDKYWIKKCFDI